MQSKRGMRIRGNVRRGHCRRERPKKNKLKFDIISAQPEMAEELTDVVNWAYRGKSGQQVCEQVFHMAQVAIAFWISCTQRQVLALGHVSWHVESCVV